MEILSLRYNIIKTSKLFHSRTEEPVYLIDVVRTDYGNGRWEVVNEEPLTYSEARALHKLLTGVQS